MHILCRGTSITKKHCPIAEQKAEDRPEVSMDGRSVPMVLCARLLGIASLLK
jgi:hypothetical protein